MKNIFFALISVLLISCKSNNDLQGNEYQTIGDAGLEITLGFSDKNNDFHGQAINNYFGSYHAKNGKIKLSTTGTTMMAGPMPLMDAERAYFEFLDKADTYKIEGNKLIISTPEKEMIFEKTSGE